MTKILITGGAGYLGSVLTPYLLSKGYQITVIDLMIYGEEVLKKHRNLKIVKGDIRDVNLLNEVIPNHDIIIHLACISNDSSFELNPTLGKSINLDAFEPLVKIAKNNAVKKFIYASTSSVYGIKNERDVHEEMVLEPLTDYSKYKAQCEIILNKYISENFTPVTIRPATICGYALRQRLDVIVNILTNLAYNKREISIFGGNQLRPNIHIKDMVKAYEVLIKASNSKIKGQVFNVGNENKTVSELAQTVKSVVGKDVTLKTIPTNDNRSYHISSKKIKDVLGFDNNFTISSAVQDLVDGFKNKLFTDSLHNEKYFNIKTMNKIKLV